MRILAIESSCDETAAAVLTTPFTLHSSVVASQIAFHAPYGGVVPEIASRYHVTAIAPVVRQALHESGFTLDDIDAIAATSGPGLIGSLMVGVQFAKGLAFSRGLPWLGVHHLQGHLCAPFLGKQRPDFPFVALLVSGGHTGLYELRAIDDIRCLGMTRDDAAGEAFDKVATLIGLGYPGGVAIEKAARGGDASRYKLPRAMRSRRNLDFSFSGLKTAARLAFEAIEGPFDEVKRRDFCASVQAAIVDSLVEKAGWALQKSGMKRLVVAGGVSANGALRQALQNMADARGLQIFVPPLAYCTDNAAMIAVAAGLLFDLGERHDFTHSARASRPLC